MFPLIQHLDLHRREGVATALKRREFTVDDRQHLIVRHGQGRCRPLKPVVPELHSFLLINKLQARTGNCHQQPITDPGHSGNITVECRQQVTLPLRN